LCDNSPDIFISNKKGVQVMKRSVAVLAVLFSFTSVLTAQRPFNFDDMMLIRRVSDPQLSPDGRTIAFVIGDVDKSANRTVNHIYTIPAGQPNSIPKQFTTGTPSASAPRWSPDGRLIAYIKGGQIWLMESDGRRERQLSKISSGAGNPVWSPDGNGSHSTPTFIRNVTTTSATKLRQAH
jgi:dipeptidyl aminopeptidase/acylaminoacyl peptidase